MENNMVRIARSGMGGWWWALLILLNVFVSETMASPTSYYIDFVSGSDSNSGTNKVAPWKRAPGMNGFTGAYTHSPGDVFILKGGVTWPAAALPLTIANSGTAENVDTYSTDHTWFSGASWSQPTFDGGGASQLVNSSGKSYLIFNDITFQNSGLAQVTDSSKALQFFDGHDLTFTNNTLKTYSWIGLYVVGTNGTTLSNITVRANDVSNVGMGIIVATAGANSKFSNVDISRNTIHDFTSKIGGGVHGDGIHLWTDKTDRTQLLDTVSIYNNVFSGSFARSFGSTGAMTADIFLEGFTQNVKIYNNVMSYTDVPVTNMYEAFISLNGAVGSVGGFQVYNNSMYGTTPGLSASMTIYNTPNSVFKNNIMSGMPYAWGFFDATSTTGTVIDNNVENVSGGPGQWNTTLYSSWSTWRSVTGQEANSVQADPLYVSPPGSLPLQNGSPAFNAGANLSEVFTTDVIGTPRPSTGAWTIGAYQGTLQPPAPPTNLTIK